MQIEGVEVIATNFIPFSGELEKYYQTTKAQVENLMKIEVELQEDGSVNINWTARGQKFERIRRITGYLVGDLSKWNNAKRSEEHERVKHGVKDYEKEM